MAVGLGALGCSRAALTEPLDCAWLASDNCWKQTVAPALQCLPSMEAGTLGDFTPPGPTQTAAFQACTFPSGAKVTFYTPLAAPVNVLSGTSSNLTVVSGGEECLRYQEVTSGFDVVVAGKKVTVHFDQGLTDRVTCPDGTTYAVADPTELLKCESDGGSLTAALPGAEWTWDGTSVSLGLLGTSSPSLLAVFSCVAPTL